MFKFIRHMIGILWLNIFLFLQMRIISSATGASEISNNSTLYHKLRQLPVRSPALDFCSEDHFTCADGSCIRLEWECDWYYDCADESDEHADCKYYGYTLCIDKHPIASWWRCDGFPDCSKGEDEADFFCGFKPICSSGHVCDKDRCIEKDELCNGVFDCQDFTDENPQMCKTDCIICDDGALCYPKSWRCDYIADCKDLSDESDQFCGPVYERCREGDFPCKNHYYCIPQQWRCDDEDDCGDMSDEVNCDKDIEWHSHQGWTEWGSWSGCTIDCGTGLQWRNRTCSKSNPMKLCPGEDSEVKKCEDSSGCAQQITKEEQCGTRFEDSYLDRRVVGGKEATHGDWPWQAQLIWLQYGDMYAACGGTLIHPLIVIGAAHCFLAYMNDRTKWLVHLGKHDIYTDDLNDYAVERHIRRIEIHPEFQSRSMENDIAILILDSPVVYEPTKHIRWACLDEGMGVHEGMECFISGWGVTAMGGYQPIQLKEAAVPILNRDVCNEGDIYDGLVKESMICAGHMEGGVDACQGDSGGPLSCRNPADGLWYLVGITSWGHGCALPRRPGIYTNVSHFSGWIKQNIEEYL